MTQTHGYDAAGRRRSAAVELGATDDYVNRYQYDQVGRLTRAMQAMQSRIEPMKQVARTLRAKRELVLNWFRAEGKLSAGIVEGFNNKLKLMTRKSYGFRTQEGYETALSHNLGALPEPESMGHRKKSDTPTLSKSPDFR
ncbi:MAG: transposase [Planctomycetota bacterium]